MNNEGFNFTIEHHPIKGMRPVGITDATYTMTHADTGLTISVRVQGRPSQYRLRMAMIDALQHVLQEL